MTDVPRCRYRPQNDCMHPERGSKDAGMERYGAADEGFAPQRIQRCPESKTQTQVFTRWQESSCAEGRGAICAYCAPGGARGPRTSRVVHLVYGLQMVSVCFNCYWLLLCCGCSFFFFHFTRNPTENSSSRSVILHRFCWLTRNSKTPKIVHLGIRLVDYI